MAEEVFTTVDDFRRYAVGRLEPDVETYYFTGSYNEQTLQDDVKAFSRYRFRPRVLRDVSTVDMTTTVLGRPISCPVGVSPVALCCFAHPDKEIAIVKEADHLMLIEPLFQLAEFVGQNERCLIGACEELKLPYTGSMGASTSIEDISASAPNCLRWAQFYMAKERSMTSSFLRLAEEAGYSAIVVTVDSAVIARNKATTSNGGKLSQKLRDQRVNMGTSFEKAWGSITWEDITWLIGETNLPVVLKGIMAGEDAREAASRGVSGVWVSSHGGRILDGVPASLDLLSEVVEAVDGRCEVYLDSGVRSGYDVIKALALGARAVFIGRPILWGLIYKGQEGVKSLLQVVKDETENAMALIGAKDISEIKRSHVIHESKLPIC